MHHFDIIKSISQPRLCLIKSPQMSILPITYYIHYDVAGVSGTLTLAFKLFGSEETSIKVINLKKTQLSPHAVTYSPTVPLSNRSSPLLFAGFHMVYCC